MDSLPNSNDPYVILNVKYHDSKKDIKRAYVKLIKKYKPEKFPKEFQKIRRAYEEILKYHSYSSPKNSLKNPLNTAKPIEKPTQESVEEKSADNEDRTSQNSANHEEIKVGESERTYHSQINEQDSKADEEENIWETNIPEINFHDLDTTSLDLGSREIEMSIDFDIPEIEINDLHLTFFVDIDSENDTAEDMSEDEYIEEEYKKFNPVFDTFLGDGFEDVPIDDEFTEKGYKKAQPVFDTFISEEFEDVPVDGEFIGEEYHKTKPTFDTFISDPPQDEEDEYEKHTPTFDTFISDPPQDEEDEYEKHKPTFDTFYLDNNFEGAYDDEVDRFDYFFCNGLRTFEEVYFLWLTEREKINFRMVELFPEEENAYIFAFLLDEIAGNSVEKASKWLKLAISRGVDIFDFIDEVLIPAEVCHIMDQTFAWNKMISIKTRWSAKAKLTNYIHILLYYEEHNRALYLIDDDTFFEDTWHFPQLGLVEVALQVSSVLAWYNPQRGEQIFQKYTGASSENIEFIAKDAYALSSAWQKIEKKYHLPFLKRFLAISGLSLENIDFAIYEMYVSMLKNNYLTVLRTMEKENPLFLQFILGQIAKYSNESVISRVDEQVEKETLHYLFSSGVVYNNISGILTTLLGFFSISGLVYIVYCLIAMFSSFHWGYFLSIFAIPMCVVGIVKLLNIVEKYGYEEWLCPKLAKLVVHTFHDFGFVATRENVNIKFHIEDDPCLLVVQQLSLLGKRFFRQGINFHAIFNALIYEEKRKMGLPMRDFCIFTQMTTTKGLKNTYDFTSLEKSRVNIAILDAQKKVLQEMHRILVKSPQKFLREMGIIDRRHRGLSQYYIGYLRHQTRNIKQPRPPIFPRISFSQPAVISAVVVGIITTLLLYIGTEKIQGSMMLGMSLACLSFVAVRRYLYYKKIRLLIAKFALGTKITPKQLLDCIMQKDLREYVKKDRVVHSLCWTARIRLL
ncbi:hypothetical protein [Candidatus Uabimicrobium amorphum]|uniref:hypothetical protein n=1 Tax=Uabimicrobium amorphum TaxID=2596890 RepID=UPI0034A339FB